ncbi:F-box/RNI/FBD-like domain protein, partial [Trifolium medium]|nr:F-box/RNI/FBD-like domain protein [Trifolium medium]
MFGCAYLLVDKLPPNIFSYKTLVALHMRGLLVNDLSNVVVDLPRLKTLHLSRVSFQSVEYLTKAEVLHVELNMMKHLNTSYRQFPMCHNLTNMELILKNNHSEKWNWLLEVLNHSPKLQNLTILTHEDPRHGYGILDNWMDP